MAGIGLSIPTLGHGFSPLSPVTDPNATPRPVEAITLSTIHAMLGRVLEQTYTLWQAQASTSYTLQELRHTIAILQENANVHERLRRIEDVTEMFKAHGTYQSSFLPHNVPKSSIHNVGEILDPGPQANSRPISSPNIPKQEALYHIDSKSQGLSVGTRNSENGNKNAEEKEQLTANFQAKLPEPQPMAFPSVVKEGIDQSLGVPGLHTSSTSHADMPSGMTSDNASRAGRELLGMENESLIPSSSNESSTVAARSDQNTFQDPASKNIYVSQEIVGSDQQQHSSGRERGGSLTGHEKRITSLEEGLAHLWIRFDGKQQLPYVQESVPRVVDEISHNQLTDLTSLVQRVFAICGENKVLMEEQWTEGLRWKDENTRLMKELMGMTSCLVDDQTRKEKEESNRFELVLENIQRHRAEQKELLSQASDSWRADMNRQHEETINAVHATANEQVFYNIQGYLDEFTKSLSSEIRMLLGEVGKLREERRNMQHELGYLMTVRSTLGPNGFEPFDGPPGYTSPHEWPSPAGIPLPESPRPHSGWHRISVSTRRWRYAPGPESQLERVQHPLWTYWYPNPALAPTPPPVGPPLLTPGSGSPGLFGPRSPRSEPLPEPQRQYSWSAWQPDPALAPTPPSPFQGGLFGPRSPSSLHRDPIPDTMCSCAF